MSDRPLKKQNTCKDYKPNSIDNEDANSICVPVQMSSELIALLKWSTKEQIIVNLNKLSAILLYEETISNQKRDTLNREIDELIVTLINLPPKSDCRRNVQLEKNLLVAQISRDVKCKLIDHLIKNKDFAILHSDSILKTDKRKVADTNIDLISDLLKLPMRPVEELTSNTIASGDQTQAADRISAPQVDKEKLMKKKVLLVEEVIGLREQLEDVKGKLNAFINKNETLNLFNEINTLKNALNMRPGFSAVYELPDAWSFQYPKRMDILHFYCQGVIWFMSIVSSLHNGKMMIGLYLNCKGSMSKWALKTNYSLAILTRIPHFRPDKISSFTYTFSKDEAAGVSDFIHPAEMVDEKLGFVKNKKIALQLSMSAIETIKSDLNS